MTRQETAKLLFVIRSVFPKYYQNLPDKDMAMMVDAWHMMLEEYDYNAVAASLKAYTLANASGFPPTPGQLVENIAKVRSEHDDAVTAWQKVRKALRNGNYGAEEEYDKLPPMIQKALGGAATIRAWSNVPSETLESVQMSQFIKAYNAVITRDEQDRKIPDAVKIAMKESEALLA